MHYLPKLQQLRVFNEIKRCGSIRAAAKSLNQSQPALSRSLRELEQLLSTTLLIRNHDGITLTEAGQAFSVYSTLIMEELERATHDISAINKNSEGDVSFGMSSLIALTVLPDILSDFKKSFPKTRLWLKESQLSTLLPSLREGVIDFAIGTLDGNIPLSEFVIEPLFTAPFGVVARKGHPLSHMQTLSDLQQAKWLLPETGMGYYHSLNQVLPFNLNDCPEPPIFSDSSICITSLVLQQDYLTVLSLARVCQPHFREALCLLPIVEPLPYAHYHLIRLRKHPLSLPACSLINEVKWHCQHYNWHPDNV